MSRFDLYGCCDRSLEDVVPRLESALGIQLELRDSSYRGVYYSFGRTNNYLLQRNDEGSRWHSQFPQYGIVLMVSELPGMDAIREKLTEHAMFVFLQSAVVENSPVEYLPDDEGI